jgi:hypothetical protein
MSNRTVGDDPGEIGMTPVIVAILGEPRKLPKDKIVGRSTRS